jgi:archaellum biogenesis protein FlaJ (TadC family)
MIPGIIFAIAFIVLAVIFLMGKGDKLIAGYNTASEEEKRKVDIHRLRIIMAIVSVITAVFCFVQPFLGSDPQVHLASGVIFFLVLMIFIILANTWAKKK